MSSFDGLTDEWRAQINSELSPGELLLWVDRPMRSSARDARIRRMISILVPVFFIAVGCGGLAWTIRQSDSDLFGALFVVTMLGLLVSIFVVLGLVSSFNEQWSENRKRRGSIFALSVCKAILWQTQAGSRAVCVMTFPARSIGSIHRLEFPDGSGDVIFRGNLPYLEFTGFLGVMDVRRVEQLAKSVLIDPDFHRAALHDLED